MIDIEQVRTTLLKHGYEYMQTIGQGTFSTVLLCQSQKYNQKFAIKRAIKHKITELEFNILVSLNSTNIIRVYDTFEDDEAQYFVNEYCSQGTVKSKGCLSYDKFIHYARQILEAVKYCHSKKIAHRDIKPENIFIDEYDHIKMADFGMAKIFESNVKSSEKCGSLMFMSPEVIQCQSFCPFKADIWALGVTFYYMITGNYPFQGNSREELKRMIFLGDFDFDSYDIDPQIRFMISKMTSRNVDSRPTADKLLKYPMFMETRKKKNYVIKDKGIGRIFPPVYYTQSTIMPAKLNTFEDIEKFKSDDNENQKRTLNYKELNFSPKIHRIKPRIRVFKKL